MNRNDLAFLDQRYRKFVIALVPILTVAFVSFADSLDQGRSFHEPFAWAQALVAVATAVGVYVPEHPAVKFVAALAGAAGSALVAGLAGDNIITTAEWLQLGVAVLAAVGVGAIPNSGAAVDTVEYDGPVD